MLLLSRKAGESIVIGENVRIRILSINDGQVKVGIEAPASVKIYRTEVYDAIQKENALASKTLKSSAARAAGLLSKIDRKK